MSAVRQTWQVNLRYLRVLGRQPAYLGITLTQPIIWLLLFGQLFTSVVDIPGFAAGYRGYALRGAPARPVPATPPQAPQKLAQTAPQAAHASIRARMPSASSGRRPASSGRWTASSKTTENSRCVEMPLLTPS